MKLLLPFVCLFALLFTMKLKSSSQTQSQLLESFWEKERNANLTRRKDISNLDYITIPFETLPFLENPSERIQLYEQDVRSFRDKKLLNLSGINNTDLKLSYGPANLPTLIQYDENYMKLIAILGKWAQALMDENYINEAQVVLETAVEAGCDSSSIYLNLASIYRLKGTDKIPYLLQKIESSPSAMKNVIIKKLKEL